MTINKENNGFHSKHWADVRQWEKQSNRERVRGGEDQEQDRGVQGVLGLSSWQKLSNLGRCSDALKRLTRARRPTLILTSLCCCSVLPGGAHRCALAYWSSPMMGFCSRHEPLYLLHRDSWWAPLSRLTNTDRNRLRESGTRAAWAAAYSSVTEYTFFFKWSCHRRPNTCNLRVH